MVDDVGQFPPLLLSAPRHGGRLSDTLRTSVPLNKTSSNDNPQTDKTPPQKPKVRVRCFVGRTECGPSLSSATNLPPDRVLLRVPGVSLRAPGT